MAINTHNSGSLYYNTLFSIVLSGIIVLSSIVQ